MISDPRVLASSNPGLKLANAFGVFKLNQYFCYCHQRMRSYTFTAPATSGANGLQVLSSLNANVTWSAQKLRAETEAESQRIQTEADILALRQRAQAAEAYTSHPALLRLRELDTLRELARTANARIYIGFDKHMQSNGGNGGEEK